MKERPRYSVARYGSLGEHAEWKAVLENYYWDRLDLAHEQALSLGAGLAGGGLRLYRMVEAEAVTRERSTTRRITEWLDMEFLPDEVEFNGSLAQAVLSACDDVAERLQWSHGPKTLISILAEETDAPWTSGRHGYMVDKYPYEKICIPVDAVRSEERLTEVIAHEYAHVVNLNATQGRISRWLDEAIAMVAQNGAVDVRGFRTGSWTWHAPERLDAAYQAEQSEPDGSRLVWAAYQQSAILGHYLVSVGDAKSLGNLLKAFSNNSNWTELKMAVTGQSHEDEALREVYGFGMTDLFERAHSLVH